MPQTYIYRITHYKNLPFILQNGLHCATATTKDSDFTNIGFKKLIGYRSRREVEKPPGGKLNDYVPFFFCKKPVMLYPIAKNHVEDYSGTQEEIIYLVSSAELVQQADLPFVFTDRHALLEYTNYYNRIEDLAYLDWDKIKTEKWGLMYDETKLTQEVKQAEFLIHNHMPIKLIKAIVCATETTLTLVKKMVKDSGHDINLLCKPDYYY